MELTVTSVDYAPGDLYQQVPFKIRLLRMLPGPDRPNCWLGELVRPVTWLKDNHEKQIDHVVVYARWVGTQIAPSAKNLPINIAYVTDPTQLTDDAVEFSKCAYVAIGVASVQPE